MAKKKNKKSEMKKVFSIEHSKIKRLEDAIEKLDKPRVKNQRVRHGEIYTPLRKMLKDYQNAEEVGVGRGVTKNFLEGLYKQVYDGGSFILHISRDTGLKGFREDTGTHRHTMKARLEYMDSLIEVAYQASEVISTSIHLNEALRLNVPDLKEKKVTTRYTKTNLRTWQEVRGRVGSATALLVSSLKNRDKKKFIDDTQTAFNLYKGLATASHQIYDKGIEALDKVMGTKLWRPYKGK